MDEQHKIVSSTTVQPYTGARAKYCAICGKPAAFVIFDGAHTSQHSCSLQLHIDLIRAALGGVDEIDLAAGGLVVEDAPVYVAPVAPVAAVSAHVTTWAEVEELRRQTSIKIFHRDLSKLKY